MDWTINGKSNFCVDGSGLTAYFDPNQTASGAVRCLGPFGNAEISPSIVKSRMKELTLQIEDIYRAFDGYVVWGQYCVQADYSEHAVTVLGSTCGYIPFVGARSALFEPGSENLTPEWRILSGKLRHRSGLSFPAGIDHELDPSVYHPVTIRAALAELKKHAQRLFDIPKQSTSVIPMLRWTPIASSQLAI